MLHDQWSITRTESSTVVQIMAETGLSHPLAVVLAGRGFDSKEKIASLCNPTDPLWQHQCMMPDLEKAVSRIRRAVEQKEKILIYGDRDVDGITATVILVQTIKNLGGDVLWYVTGEEGYGLNSGVLARFLPSVNLVVTVDCGITALAEAELCTQHSVDLIITDHHEPPDKLPAAYALVNPKLHKQEYGNQNLAGCGVALIIAHALMLTYSKYHDDRIIAVQHAENGWKSCVIKKFRITDELVQLDDPSSCTHAVLLVPDTQTAERLRQVIGYADDDEKLVIWGKGQFDSPVSLSNSFIQYQVYEHARIKYFLKETAALATLGCLADMVPLLKVNRWIVRKGLEELKKTLKPGIQLLHKYFCPYTFSADRPLSSNLLVWKYIPLLNAAGRCGKASKAVELLLTDSLYAAQELFSELLNLNEERKRLQEANAKVFDQLLATQFDSDQDKLIFLTARTIPHGVLGIIANRLMKRFNRPVALLIQQGNEVIGTMRSPQGFDSLGLLGHCKDLLMRFGGHRYAAGFTLDAANVRSFKEKILHKASDMVHEEVVSPAYTADGILPLEELDAKFINELYQFEPYGSGWELPRFCLQQQRIKSLKSFGASGQHIRLKVYNEHAAVDAVGWDMHRIQDRFLNNDLWDLMVQVEIAQKNSEDFLCLNIRDMNPSFITELVKAQ